MTSRTRTEVISEILQNRIDEFFQANGNPVFPSSHVWREIAIDLEKNYNITLHPKSIYNIAIRISKLASKTVESKHKDASPRESFSESDSDKNFSNEDELNFTITLSSQEWDKIKPIDVKYNRGIGLKNYTILPVGEWSSLFFSHFWHHTKVPCAISFKRAQVYKDNPNIYIKIIGNCKECGSEFTSELKDKPKTNDDRILFRTKYKGPFKEILAHQKKRHLSSGRRKETAKNLVETNASASASRRLEAAKLMQFGDPEPPHLPSAGVLRVAAHEYVKKQRLSDDIMEAVYESKYRTPYSSYIKDIGLDKIFLHYWSTVQLHVYNEYCRSSMAKISIDATGGVVRKIVKPNGEKSGSIFLYDVTVNDPRTRSQYSVCNMLSERHDGDSIGHWLTRWVRDGASTPKEIVSDMSLALLSGISKSFAKMNNITEYVNKCYNILINRQPLTLLTYIRCDVAHVIKIFVSFKCLKGQRSRTKQFYVRSLAKVLLSTDLEEVRYIFECIFVVAKSETEGEENGRISQCDEKKNWLKNLIAEGSETTDERVILENMFTDADQDLTNPFDTNEELPTKSLFEMWVRDIVADAEPKTTRNGDRDNLQYLPEIIPEIINIARLLPLWSAIMAPIFLNVNTVASSAPVESNFNNLKNRIFKNANLPLRLDDFIQKHISSLEGTISLVEAATNLLDISNMKKIDDAIVEDEEAVEMTSSHHQIQDARDIRGKEPTQPLSVPMAPFADVIVEDKEAVEMTSPHHQMQDARDIRGKEPTQPLSVPTAPFADVIVEGKEAVEMTSPHHQIQDTRDIIIRTKEPTPPLSVPGITDSNHIEIIIIRGEDEEEVICPSSLSNCTKLVEEETKSVENWRGEGVTKNRRPRKSYLENQEEWKFVDLQSKMKTIPISLIRNGNFSNLKAIVITGKKYCFSNTCSLDSILSIITAGYCDSLPFRDQLDGEDNNLVKIVKSLVGGRINRWTYVKRGEIMKDIFTAETKPFGITNISAISTIPELLKKLMAANYLKWTKWERVKKCNFCGKGQQVFTSPTVTVIHDNLDIGLGKVLESTTLHCEACDQGNSAEVQLNEDYIFVEWLTTKGDDRLLRLQDIPAKAVVKNSNYTLQGAIEVTGTGPLGTEIGHFIAHSKRLNGKWEQYNDLKEKVETRCPLSTVIRCVLLFYVRL